LKAAGYLTAWIGKWHLESEPQGFDYWEILPAQGQYYNPDFLMMNGKKRTVEGYVSNIVEDVSENWLDKRDKSKPFCLVIGHKATHRTWIPDTCDMGKFDKVNFPLPHDFYDDYSGRIAAQKQDMTISKTMIMGYDLKMLPNDTKESTVTRMNPAQREKFDAYYKPIQADLQARNLLGNALTEWKYQRYLRDYLSTATSLDRNIGRTLNYLDTHDLTANTIVIYMSDQGFYLGEHGWFDKRWMYEESFRTPMMMRYPGVIKPGSRSDDFVLNVDIAPTILDAAKVAIPKEMQGESMLPLFTDKKAKGRSVIYYHYYENGEHAVSPQFGVRTRRYKLIRFYKRVNNWELYDLQNDTGEMKNLYGKTKYEKITAKLKKELNKQIEKYQDDDAKLILAQD
jgi:arylsulfatase A-like enzyme